MHAIQLHAWVQHAPSPSGAHPGSCGRSRRVAIPGRWAPFSTPRPGQVSDWRRESPWSSTNGALPRLVAMIDRLAGAVHTTLMPVTNLTGLSSPTSSPW